MTSEGQSDASPFVQAHIPRPRVGEDLAQLCFQRIQRAS